MQQTMQSCKNNGQCAPFLSHTPPLNTPFHCSRLPCREAIPSTQVYSMVEQCRCRTGCAAALCLHVQGRLRCRPAPASRLQQPAVERGGFAVERQQKLAALQHLLAGQQLVQLAAAGRRGGRLQQGAGPGAAARRGRVGQQQRGGAAAQAFGPLRVDGLRRAGVGVGVGGARTNAARQPQKQQDELVCCMRGCGAPLQAQGEQPTRPARWAQGCNLCSSLLIPALRCLCRACCGTLASWPPCPPAHLQAQLQPGGQQGRGLPILRPAGPTARQAQQLGKGAMARHPQ